jgi:hypothetical protein
MGAIVRKPKTLGVRDVFMFWLKNLEKEKPYLVTKRRYSHSLDPMLCTKVWYTIKHELDYLRKKILTIEEEILELELADTDRSRFTSMTVRTFELRKEVFNIKAKITNLSKFSPDDKKLLMSYELFHRITVAYNRKAVKAVIDGEVLNLGNRLGEIKIRKIKRYSPAIDWAESNIRKQELIDSDTQPKTKEHPDGEEWFVYRDSPFYLRWSWSKSFRDSGVPLIKNGKCYAFYPTNSSSNKKVLGAKGLLAKANQK